MKKSIRLTENELVSLIKKIVKEQEDRLEVDDNEVVDINENRVKIKNASAETVREVLSNIPESVYFITIQNSEEADFSNVDICSLLRLVVVTIINTPTNFEDVVGCSYNKIVNGDKIHYDMDDEENMN